MQPDQILQQRRQQQLQESLHQSVEATLSLQQQTAQEEEHQELHEQAQPDFVRHMGTVAEVREQAGPATLRESKSQRKKRQEQEKALYKAEQQSRQVRILESNLLQQRSQLLEGQEMTAEEIRREKALLTEKLKEIQLQEEARFQEAKAAGGLNEADKREIRWQAQAKRAEAAGSYARLLPPGSQERQEAMALKEQLELKADKLRRLYKVTQIVHPAEQQREEATVKRHSKYDTLKSVFKKDNPLAHEDAVWTHPDNGHLLVNVGRAYFGGTKPMYIFEDRQAPVVREGRTVGYKQYLFKEAVNCIGFYKPEGALVTAAAAKLQERICGPMAIAAFAAIQANGKVLGSFQEKLDVLQGQEAVDLFSWQADPSSHPPLEEEMKKEILREHTLDWLLCNFDTKGENFLHRSDGHLSSFDKEASFGRLKDKEAQQMSATYQPHANNTLYNVLFSQFAQGNLTLDLRSTATQLERIEGMDRAEYLALFGEMLTQKYGPADIGNQARGEAEAQIWARKENLREEYRRFYGELLLQRRASLLQKGQPDDTKEYLDDYGRFRFRAKAIAPIPLLEKSTFSHEDATVLDIPQEELQTGATFMQLTMAEAEAKLLVESSNGFLTLRRAGDGVTLRPSMPETVAFNGEQVAFRKNYKRFTAIAARLAVTQEGTLNPAAWGLLGGLNNAVVDQMVDPSRASDEIFTQLMLPHFVADVQLCGDQTPQEAMDEFIRFMRLARGYNPTDEKVESTYALSVFNAEWIGSIRVMAALGQRLAESQEQIEARIRAEMVKDPEITEGMAQQMLADLPAFRRQHEAAVATLQRCANQDMASEEVFLLGACSANQQLIATTLNPIQKGRGQISREEFRLPRYELATEEILRRHPEIVEERMSALLGEPYVISRPVDHVVVAEVKRAIEKYLAYTYHVGGQIGVANGVGIALETFAAETYQVTSPGLTDQVGIGLYRSSDDFEEYYSRNRGSVMSPEQMRMYKLKCILGEGL